MVVLQTVEHSCFHLVWTQNVEGIVSFSRRQSFFFKWFDLDLWSRELRHKSHDKSVTHLSLRAARRYRRIKDALNLYIFNFIIQKIVHA